MARFFEGVKFGLAPLALFCALCVLSFLPSIASAQSCTNDTGANMCDQGAAYMAALTWANAEAARRSTACTGGCGYVGVVVFQPNTVYIGQVKGGNTFIDVKNFYFRGSCIARESAPGGSASIFMATSDVSGVCYQGCFYSMGSTGTTYKVGATNKSVMTSTGLAPNGTVCGVANTPATTPQCVADGTLTQCVKPDGSHCSAASNGTQFCWGKSESGVKKALSGNEAATKSPDGAAINPPRDPPKNGGDWKAVGQSTTSITNNSTTTNYNVTNYNSSYGGSGSGTGTGPDTGGGGEGEGEGEGEGDNDYGTVGGDGSCPGTFSCSGGDPVLCAIAQQTWRDRCDAESRFGGGAAPFPGAGDGGAGTDPDPKDSHKSATPSIGLIDQMGFAGGGSCPTFNAASTSWGDFALNQEDFCKLINVARTCIILLGAFIALCILMGWGFN